MIQFVIDNIKDLVPDKSKYEYTNETNLIELAAQAFDHCNMDILFAATESTMNVEYGFYGYSLEDPSIPCSDSDAFENHIARKSFDVANALMSSGYKGSVMLLTRYWSKHSPTKYRVYYFFGFEEFKSWAYNRSKDRVVSNRVGFNPTEVRKNQE